MLPIGWMIPNSLELMFETQSLNVNFRFKVLEGIDADAFNKKLRYQLLQDGKAMVNYCHLDEALSIRLVLLNPDLTEEDLNRFFESFVQAGNLLLQSEPHSAV